MVDREPVEVEANLILHSPGCPAFTSTAQTLSGGCPAPRVYSNYGSPDVLKCEEIEKPTAGDDEVLVKGRSAAVNPDHFHFLGQIRVDAKSFGGFTQSLISCPQKCGRIDKDGGY